MKNYKDSDYALNKFSKGIVYRFADGIVEITLESFLAENPSMTESDFRKFKHLSDAIYLNQARDENAQTNKNELFDTLEKTALCRTQSAEEKLINVSNWQDITEKQLRLEISYSALDKLTAIQRRRYLLRVVDGLTTRAIAEKDGVTHQAVVESLAAAEKKIKTFLGNSKKHPAKTP